MNLVAAKVISMNAAVTTVYVQSRLLLVEKNVFRFTLHWLWQDFSYSVVFSVER